MVGVQLFSTYSLAWFHVVSICALTILGCDMIRNQTGSPVVLAPCLSESGGYFAGKMFALLAPWQQGWSCFSAKRYAIVGLSFTAVQLTTTYLSAAVEFSLPVVPALVALY